MNPISFIETQFPVAKISMESYKERTAKQSQTLTGLGKWWGRKPLILVRAALLGLLMPASDDPQKDREIYLKILTMDREGLRLRKNKPIPAARLIEELKTLPASTQKRYLEPTEPGKEPALRKMSKAEKEELQALVFDRMVYREAIEYCARPEQVEGPSEQSWKEINAHLGTYASSLPELIQELGEKRFGRTPRVGDSFCGGGSIPFEAARLGCNAFGSDLNPMAALLTWSALNILGKGKETVQKIRAAQEKVFRQVDRQVTEWGIEHNSLGWRADTYLYCTEVVDPETGWKIPLTSSWVIGEKTRTVAKLVPNEKTKSYEIEIIQNATDQEIEEARKTKTVEDYRLISPNGGHTVPIDLIRKDMRLWENSDITPRPDDVFQERLFCIRWVETYSDAKGNIKTRRHYRAPSQDDFARERKVFSLLNDRFNEWQENGFIPRWSIQDGVDINRPKIARGWTHWHHLFNPRQLLLTGLFSKSLNETNLSFTEKTGILLGVGRLADWNSRLSRWVPDAANEKSAQTFYKPSLSTPFWNYCCRAFLSLDTVFLASFSGSENPGQSCVALNDAKSIAQERDIWITDPPYADAVSYHQLSEFFLAWYEQHLPRLFPGWYSDSKRALAVSGTDDNFKLNMVACYRNLTSHMLEHGFQVVMFTHQDAGVWADLTMILWAAGLRVTAAWTIATETESTLKQGNFVQGTVILVLHKRSSTETVFLDEINYPVETEVRKQLDSMLKLEDNSDPNFGDADYQLAAYAAALRVLTEQPIEDIDPEKEILRERKPGEISPVEKLIRQAVKIACDHLVPRGIDGDLWKSLGPLERFYLKGLEVESHGEYRSGVYQELARGFGAADYTDLLASTKANETRLKSAIEFGRKYLSGAGFGETLVRQCLYAVALTVKSEETKDGMNWLRTEIKEYWSIREKIALILEYLAGLRYSSSMEHWKKDAESAQVLAGAVRNDHV